MDKNLLEVSMMLGNAIDKLNNLSAYKPKEKKKLYKWAFRNRTEITHTEYWLETECFYETKVDAANNAHGLHGLLDTEIIRIDSSMIEVDA